MLILLSPAKTQNFEITTPALNFTQPQTQKELASVISTLKTYTSIQLEKLMSISHKLAELNYQRFQNFVPKSFTLQNSKPAAYAFEGDVYRYLAVNKLSLQEVEYLQDHLLILSGLYGYLRPLDLIQPYRLEMGTQLQIGEFKNLYAFWRSKITAGINHSIKEQGHRLVVNLASEEYSKAVEFEKLTVPSITIIFKEKRGSDYKTIGIHAKRARGLMARFIITHKINNSENLKKFSEENYKFYENSSNNTCFCFVR